jgi:hypothetical protein
MRKLLSPRAETIPKSHPAPCPQPMNDHCARADGLTTAEAIDLAARLTSAGYDSVVIVNEPDHASVVWRR